MATEAQDEIAFGVWISQAEPGATITYHQGFLAVDGTAPISKLSGDKPAVSLRQLLLLIK